MAKFHIKKDGTPGRCTATGRCPLGGKSGHENHFNTMEEAQAAADKLNSNNFSNDKPEKLEFEKRIKHIEIRDNNYGDGFKGSKHNKSDHKERHEFMKTLPAGKTVKNFYVEELPDPEHPDDEQPVVFSIKDNGTMEILSTKSNVIITSMPPSLNKVKSLYNAAGEEMPKELESKLKEVQKNYKKYQKDNKKKRDAEDGKPIKLANGRRVRRKYQSSAVIEDFSKENKPTSTPAPKPKEPEAPKPEPKKKKSNYAKRFAAKKKSRK